MNLFLIRHAESVNNRIAESNEYADFIATRSFDPEITDTGEKQAEALATHLASSSHPEFIRKGKAPTHGYGITRIVASPMLRTLRTATPTARALGLPLEVWTDIHEQGGLFDGDPTDADAVRSYPGLKRAEMLARFGELLLPDEVTEAGWWRGGYEDYPQSAARAVAVAERLTALAEAEPQTHLAFVSHGTFLNQLLHVLLGVPNESSMYFFHANTGITRMEFTGDGFRVLRYTNRIAHLAPEIMTR